MSPLNLAMRMRLVELTVLVLWTISGVASAQGNAPGPAPAAASAPTVGAVVNSAENRSTAVALNYCRAAFHRIRKEPTRAVLHQEQEKILNNLNLDAVADPEVIQLYTAVLDEINQVGVADYERTLYREQHKNSIQKKLAWDVLALGADVATAQVGNAVRSGANSWWDYRAMNYQRDQDLLKIEKARINSVVQKSSQFMDTFWKLAQKKKIPDKWLVRGSDLDSLELAMREPNPEVRLRVLKRMEDFMECYPPYWYYTGRTQQEQGQLTEAAQTYSRLEQLGQGHFRKDDMLATALANQAAIEDFSGQLTAAVTAHRALSYSRDVWEANLVCARVLERGARTSQAEDAILCNLDTHLETQNSHVFLVSLYQKTGETTKLTRVLSNPQVVAQLPAPLLLRCAATLGEETPATVYPVIMASLDAQPQFQFGKDELVIRATPVWQLHLASLRVLHEDQLLPAPQITTRNGEYLMRFAGNGEFGAPFENPRNLAFKVQLTYPDQSMVEVTLRPDPQAATVAAAPGRALFNRTAQGISTTTTFKISELRLGDQQIALGNASPGTPLPASPGTLRQETAKPAFPPLPVPSREDDEEAELLPPIDATGDGLRTSAVRP